jgi:hypothetical protein
VVAANSAPRSADRNKPYERLRIIAPAVVLGRMGVVSIWFPQILGTNFPALRRSVQNLKIYFLSSNQYLKRQTRTSQNTRSPTIKKKGSLMPGDVDHNSLKPALGSFFLTRPQPFAIGFEV